MNPWFKLFLLSSLMLMLTPAQAALLKWVDENGQVHYGDRIPPEYSSQARTELNERGLVVNKVEKGKSKEQIELERKEREENAESNKQKLLEQRRQALRDRMLLESYTTERDILIQRDARVDAVVSQITLTETIIKDQEKKLADLKKRIEGIQNSKREVPENLHKDVIAVGRQLETHYQYVENKTAERQGIMASFDEDIKRFRELKAEQKAAREN